ncbi:MAG: exodeoxyribonuclease III [Alphaproteobacteria bacterium]|nr:exodeoxyribonuclease III [Alphaproteobacteria bacterium]
MSWTLGTVNVNGMRAAVRNGFPAWRGRSGCDVLCLQELRMQEDQMTGDHTEPRGWKRVQVDAEKKGYSGASVWSRLPVVDQGTGIGLDWADAEGRVAWMQLDRARVYSVYLPSGSSGEARQAMKERFMAHFFDWSRDLLATGAPIAICGDLNIAHAEADIHNPGANKKNSGFLPHEREWFSELLGLGWTDCFRAANPDAREYSWWSNRGQARALDRGWRIDYILASPALAATLESSSIVGRTPALSDHCPVLATFGA